MDDLLIDVIKKLKLLQYEFDIVVSRDCTVPFIRNSDMKKSIDLLKKKKCDLVCGVYRQHHNPYFNMMEKNSKNFLKFSKKTKQRVKSRQEAPIVYQLNGLFTLDVKQFLKFNRIYMPKILPLEIPPETGLMIDTEFEFQIANQIMKKQIKI